MRRVLLLTLAVLVGVALAQWTPPDSGWTPPDTGWTPPDSGGCHHGDSSWTPPDSDWTPPDSGWTPGDSCHHGDSSWTPSDSCDSSGWGWEPGDSCPGDSGGWGHHHHWCDTCWHEPDSSWWGDETLYTISGYVYDEVTGEPVAHAMISAHFYFDDWSDDSFWVTVRDSGDFSGGFYHRHHRHHFGVTFSDSTGYYELTLPAGEYVLGAHHWRYFPWFYDGHTNPLEADPFEVDGDATLDIYLTPIIPTAEVYTLFGVVTDEVTGEPIEGAMVVFIPEGMAGLPTHIPRLFAVTDDSGMYSVDLPEGDYIALAAAPGYIPEFYDDAYLWSDATVITVSGPRRDPISFDLVPIVFDTSGFDIGGVVFGDSLLDTTGFLRAAAAEVPLAGVRIYLIQDGIAKYSAITDDEGNFSISGIQPGTYQLYADKYGYLNETLVVDGPGTYNVTLEKSALGVDEKSVPEVLKISAAPNPFNAAVNISVAVPAGERFTLSIYDNAGHLVRTLYSGESTGDFSTTWNATDAASGNYFVVVRSASGISVQKIELVK